MANDWLTEGLHRGVPMEKYVSDPCPEPSVSKGVIHKIITQSPAHARWSHPRLNPGVKSEDGARLDIGSAVHSAVLGGADLAFAPEEFEDWRKKEAQVFRDTARATGKIPLLASNRAQIEGAASAARALLGTLAGWKKSAQDTEGTFIWKDGPTWKRGRYDIWAPSLGKVIDVKTTTNAEPSSWIRSSLVTFGYDIQAAHYLAGLKAIGEAKATTEFLFLVVEIEPPFCATFVGLDESFMTLARRKVQHGTEVWQRCVERNEWPGYRPFPHWAEAPVWAEENIADRIAYARDVEVS